MMRWLNVQEENAAAWPRFFFFVVYPHLMQMRHVCYCRFTATNISMKILHFFLFGKQNRFSLSKLWSFVCELTSLSDTASPISGIWKSYLLLFCILRLNEVIQDVAFGIPNNNKGDVNKTSSHTKILGSALVFQNSVYAEYSVLMIAASLKRLWNWSALHCPCCTQFSALGYLTRCMDRLNCAFVRLSAMEVPLVSSLVP